MIKNKKYTFIILVCVLSGLGLALAFNLATAASPSPLYVEPNLEEITLLPGEKFSGSLTVYNASSFGTRLKISARDFFAEQVDGRTVISFKEAADTAGWVIPQYLEITLAPGQSKKIEYYVQVPSDAAIGDHYGAIVFTGAEVAAAKPTKEFGELLYITVIEDAAELSSFGTATINATKLFQSEGRADIDYAIRNSGDLHLGVNGYATITDWRGRTVASAETGKKIVYPNTEREFSWQWPNDLQTGIYRVEFSLFNTADSGEIGSMKKWLLVVPRGYGIYLVIAVILLTVMAVFVLFRWTYAEKKSRQTV